MRKKMIGIWDVIVIGAVNATLVGVLGLTMGADIRYYGANATSVSPA